MIRVEGLTKDYGPRRAIHELTFDARQGEILGFLGPNGAGKTTTMRILTGYMPPTSGKAQVAGFDVVDQSLEVRKRVGYMPETIPLYPDMTVIDYLKFMAELRRVKNAEDRAIELLERLHMEDRAESYISNLSKGMRQRVGLAQALVHNPEVLILDEPTIGLDPAQIIEVRNLIRELGKERTILLSTHILSEAQQLCDRVLIINKGHIVTEDTPERLQSRLIGSQRVVLQVGGDTDGIEKLVSQVPGVAALTSKEDGRLEFETAPGNDPRSQVARAVVNAGYDLIEMRPVGMSLEEIFLQLTRDEPTPPETTEQGLDEELPGDEEVVD
jgi:gliding motility-associated transport system ATP-binding protein